MNINYDPTQLFGRNEKNLLYEMTFGVGGIEALLATLRNTKEAHKAATNIRRIISKRSPSQAVDLVWLCEELEPTEELWGNLRHYFGKSEIFDLSDFQRRAKAGANVRSVMDLPRKGFLKQDIDRCFGDNVDFADGLSSLYRLVQARRQKRMDQIDPAEGSDLDINEIIASEQFSVSAILDKRVINKKKSFFIKWNGFSSEWNSWEPEENCTSCSETIRSIEAALRAELDQPLPGAPSAPPRRGSLPPSGHRAYIHDSPPSSPPLPASHATSSVPSSRGKRDRASSSSSSSSLSSSSSSSSLASFQGTSPRPLKKTTRQAQSSGSTSSLSTKKLSSTTSTASSSGSSDMESVGEHKGYKILKDYPSATLVRIWASAKIGGKIHHLCGFDARVPFLALVSSDALWSNAPEALRDYYEAHLQTEA